MLTACQALTITAITLDSDTEEGPAALDWANGIPGAMVESVGTGTNKVILQNLTTSKKECRGPNSNQQAGHPTMSSESIEEEWIEGRFMCIIFSRLI